MQQGTLILCMNGRDGGVESMPDNIPLAPVGRFVEATEPVRVTTTTESDDEHA
jgi:hypothetical protein